MSKEEDTHRTCCVRWIANADSARLKAFIPTLP